MSANFEAIKSAIENGKTILGIELGSTRIKAVLVDSGHSPIAYGSYDWENKLIDNVWTYDLEAIWTGIQTSYFKLTQDVYEQYGVVIERIGAIGISAMMHGYMVFDKNENLLVPFRTWRNTITEQAAALLTNAFKFPIPQRWSIAHLYQAILNKEAHVSEIDFQTTLEGYIHWKLTGQRVIGIGEASGMFPIDLETKKFNKDMTQQFDTMIASYDYKWKLENIFPEVLLAGENAGVLTLEGSKLLDTTGHLKPGIPLCPPEGDAGTGMVATNSIEKRTGNISAGTSVFAMIVLEKELSKVYEEIDLVTTPTGSLVAMVHSNNCTSDLNAWVGLFDAFLKTIGVKMESDALYDHLYAKALEGDPDCGGLLAYNYLSGEHITQFEIGRPLFIRTPESQFNLANFMRVHLFTSVAALKIGVDLLFNNESISIDKMIGHGGLFKTKQVGQKVIAAALNAPVATLENAGEGGAWGMALLAAYMLNKAENESLNDYLTHKVFLGRRENVVIPDIEDVNGFKTFIERYKKGLPIERAAIDFY